MRFNYVDEHGNPVELDKSIRDKIEACIVVPKQEQTRKVFSRIRFIRVCQVKFILVMMLIAVILVAYMCDNDSSQHSTTVSHAHYEETTEPIQEVKIEPKVAVVEQPQYFRPAALSPTLFNIVVEECGSAGIPVNAALAIMKTETQNFTTSSINHNTNGTYDSGIMQINSSNVYAFAERYNCPEFANNPMNAEANIRVGIRHFAELFVAYNETYNDEVKSLLAAAGAYNRGASNQNRYKNIYEYNARVYAHYRNLCEGRDVNINYQLEIPEIRNWLTNNITL